MTGALLSKIHAWEELQNLFDEIRKIASNAE